MTAKALGEQQEKHQTQQADLDTTHQTRINAVRQNLIQRYQLADKKQAIDGLQQRLEKPSWFRRVLGLEKRDRHQLAAQQKSLTDAQSEVDERINALQTQRDHQLKQLAARQERERTELKQRLEKRGPSKSQSRKPPEGQIERQIQKPENSLSAHWQKAAREQKEASTQQQYTPAKASPVEQQSPSNDERLAELQKHMNQIQQRQSQSRSRGRGMSR